MNKILSSCVIVLSVCMLSLITGCIDNLQPQPDPEKPAGTYSLTVNAEKQLSTKSLYNSGDHGIGTDWDENEKVQVYYDQTKVGELTAQSHGYSHTTLSGDINAVPDGSPLTLTIKAPSYESQDGTLVGIGKNCDYAVATVTVSVDKEQHKATPTSGATFVPQQAIVYLRFKKIDESKSTPSTPVYEFFEPCNNMTIQYGDKTIKIPSKDSHQYAGIYVAIPCSGSAQDFSITGYESDYADDSEKRIYYFYEKKNVTFLNGKNYNIDIIMKRTDLYTPLTFEAVVAPATVTFTQGQSIEFGENGAVQYSTNGTEWINYSSGTSIPLENVGDKVMFRGSLTRYANNALATPSSFSTTGTCYVYGNIMSLVNKEGYAAVTELPNISCTFTGLFKNNKNIKFSDDMNLVLPAKTIRANCYKDMFYGCTGITKSPKLPATDLSAADGCYRSMFEGSGIVKAPKLPATALSEYCYGSMFENCKSLDYASNLKATTLATSCYHRMFFGCTALTWINQIMATTMAGTSCEYMFYGCTSLSTVPALLATSLETACCQGMFYGCTSLVKAPALPATVLADSCYEEMFRGCSKLTTAPTLSAATLVNECYQRMFFECEKLDSITCLATNNTASNCTNYWLCRVKSSGTFTAISTTEWTAGDGGIPSGWTRAAYNAQ